jgi:uncharacterized damage-inducible protein DinB
VDQSPDINLASPVILSHMTDATSPRLDLTPHWQSVQDTILQVVDLIPEDMHNFTPKDNLWNSKGILIHIAATRDGWLTHTVGDGGPDTNLWTTVKSTDDIKRELSRTWERLQRFLGNQSQLDAEYDDEDRNGQIVKVTGHWIAFHLLEHDIHHRAELLQRLAHLDVVHGIDF